MFKTDLTCKPWRLMSVNKKNLKDDHMTIEILCTDLHDFGLNLKENNFCIDFPPGGALEGRCGKCRANVFPKPL